MILFLPFWCLDPDIPGWAYYQIRKNGGLCMRWDCRERFPRHRLQRNPLVSDPGMHHGTCVTHVPWCMSGSLTRGGEENVPGIPGACATGDFTYLVRGPWLVQYNEHWCSDDLGRHVIGSHGIEYIGQTDPYLPPAPCYCGQITANVRIS